MSTLTEHTHAGGFIMSEANGHRSRSNVTLKSGQNVRAGQVLGLHTGSGHYAAYDNDASDGTQTAVAISINAVDASAAAATIAVIARDAEVNGDELVYYDTSPSDATAAATDLASVGIIVR